MSAAQEKPADQVAWEKFQRFVLDNRDELRLIASWGDGRCGHMAVWMAEVLVGPYVPSPPRTKPKAAIPRALAKRVFERDQYRCVTCGGHIDLCCDHVVPESKGGATTYENLQCMCRSCNSRKGVGA